MRLMATPWRIVPPAVGSWKMSFRLLQEHTPCHSVDWLETAMRTGISDVAAVTCKHDSLRIDRLETRLAALKPAAPAAPPYDVGVTS